MTSLGIRWGIPGMGNTSPGCVVVFGVDMADPESSEGVGVEDMGILATDRVVKGA